MGLVTALAIGATVAGSALAAGSQKKAATTAANAQRDASTQNAAVQREIYGQNKEVLSPYVARGNAAGNAMNALLGLSPMPLPTAPQPNAFSQWQGYNPDSSGGVFGMSGEQPGFTMPGTITGFGSGTFDTQGNPVTVGTQGQPAPQTAANAFDTFRNSTGYQFRLGQGMNAINSGYAGAGSLQSGAAMKAITEYGQNFASNEFGNYMGYLGNQQGAGLSGASALAGVGQNYANSISANNNTLAGALGNAALIKGQNNPFASALGAFGGTILGRR